jgi:hypothetical protein
MSDEKVEWSLSEALAGKLQRKGANKTNLALGLGIEAHQPQLSDRQHSI